MKTKIVKDIEDFTESVEEDSTVYYFLKKKQGTISSYIEDSGLEDDSLLELKVAYDFPVTASLEDKRTKKRIEVNSIVEIVKHLEEKKEEYYRIILQNNNKKLMADVIQQFIYLDMKSLDIVSEQELEEVSRYNRLKEDKEDLKNFIEEFKNKVTEYSTDSKDIENDKKNIVEKIDELKQYLMEIEDRPLKICVMATKKSGKSVIVNSFLGNEYAPTSMKLATPNTVVYESWDKNIIECKVQADIQLKGYEEETIEEFETPDEIKKYINKLFKNAEKDEENKFSMPDIYIKYPKKDLEYTIIDTPGPDLAGAGHSDIAYRWIEEADAVIFVIDYSKYLTDGEEKFLRDIKAKLQEKEKFHSLIIVVNKLDLRYTSNEKKSVVDFLDFLKGRLSSLGYEDVPIMGITSLQYFSSLELQSIIEKKSYNFTKDETLTEEFFDDINEFKLSSAEKTYVNYIEESKGRLKRFHNKRKSTLNDLEYHSGMPSLIDRVHYITTTKASVEIFNNTFSKMDRSFTEIKNNFLAIRIEQLLAQKNEIMADLNDIDSYFKKKEDETNSFINKKLENETKKLLNSTFKDFSKNAKLKIEASLASKRDEMLEKEEALSISYEEIIKNLEEPLKKMITDSILDINTSKDNYVNNMEDGVIFLNNEIQAEIKRKNFEEKYNLKIALSSLEPKLAREQFKIEFDTMFDNLVMGEERVDAIEDKTIIETKTKKENKTRRGKKKDKYFQWFRSVEYEIETYSVDVEYKVEKNIQVLNQNKMNQQLKKIEEKLMKSVDFIIKAQHKSAVENLNSQILNFDKVIQNELMQVINSYKKTNTNIKDMLSRSKDSVQEVENFYKNIHTDFMELNDIWTSIVKG